MPSSSRSGPRAASSSARRVSAASLRRVRRAIEAAYRAFIDALLSITDNREQRADRRAAGSASCTTRPDSVSGRRRRQGHGARSPIIANELVGRSAASGSATPSPRAGGHGLRPQGDSASPRAAPGSARSSISASSGATSIATTVTVVGIGDMSGDVFGNGMLRSRHLRLRRGLRSPPHLPRSRSRPGAVVPRSGERLVHLPRSSWTDYARDAVQPRRRRRIARSMPSRSRCHPRRGALLDLRRRDARRRGRRSAPSCACRVDLLWNGGIGTYVEGERRVARRRRPIRPTTRCASTRRELRAAVVAEGGNLGFTQRGARRVRARAADASTPTRSTTRRGVDLSDHEVNLKIALQPLSPAARSPPRRATRCSPKLPTRCAPPCSRTRAARPSCSASISAARARASRRSAI